MKTEPSAAAGASLAADRSSRFASSSPQGCEASTGAEARSDPLWYVHWRIDDRFCCLACYADENGDDRMHWQDVATVYATREIGELRRPKCWHCGDDLTDWFGDNMHAPTVRTRCGGGAL